MESNYHASRFIEVTGRWESPALFLLHAEEQVIRVATCSGEGIRGWIDAYLILDLARAKVMNELLDDRNMEVLTQ